MLTKPGERRHEGIWWLNRHEGRRQVEYEEGQPAGDEAANDHGEGAGGLGLPGDPVYAAVLVHRPYPRELPQGARARGGTLGWFRHGQARGCGRGGRGRGGRDQGRGRRAEDRALVVVGADVAGRALRHRGRRQTRR